MIDTVRIVSPVSDDNPHGYIVINEADLAEGHELFVEPEAAPAPAAEPEPAAESIGSDKTTTKPKA